MLCPQCKSELRANASGVLVCTNCGYVDPMAGDTVNIQSPHIEPPTIQSQSFFKTHKLRILIISGILLLILCTFLTIQQIRAEQLLSEATTLNKVQLYNEAYDKLKQADGIIALPQTKQAISDSLGSTKRWVTYQANIIKAKQLMATGNYTEAVRLLKQVTSDYPDYSTAKNALAVVAKSNDDSVIPDSDIKPPSAGSAITPVPSPSPVVAAAPKAKATTPSAPKTSSSPAPTPSAAPNYIATTTLCRVDATAAPDLYQVAVNTANTCQSMFPQIEQLLSPSLYGAPHLITIVNMDGVAYTLGANVTFSASYLRSTPTDMGAVVHELTHVTQGYTSSSPSWITEGMADYIRFALGYSTSWSYSHCDAGSKYTSGYNCGAAFLKYVERVYMPTLIKTLHAKIRAGQYTDTFWSSNTGKTLDQLYTLCRSAECSGGKP